MIEVISLDTELAQFDANMERHDMGEAYKQITETLGPSAQLVAFVHFDKVISTDPDVHALESYDIVDQHQKVLDSINADPAFNMACESLSEGVKKYRKWLVGAGAAALAFAGWGPLSVALIGAGVAGIVLKSKEGDVASTQDFTELTKLFNQAYRAESLFTNAIPTTTDAKAWAEFRDDYVAGDLFEEDERTGELRTKIKQSSVEFEKSGWTVDSFKNATKWLVDNQKKVQALQKKQADKLKQCESFLEYDADKKTSSKTIKDMSMMLRVAHKSTHDSTRTLGEIESLLGKVAKHFAPKDGATDSGDKTDKKKEDTKKDDE